MPELRECVAHYLALLVMLDYFKWEPTTTPWVLKQLWVDPIKDDIARPGQYVRAIQQRIKARLPFCVTSATGVVRAPHLPIWPPALPASGLDQLLLCDVVFHPRALLLDFGARWLEFRFLTHTSVHVYSPRQWEMLREMPQGGRGYKFALVLVFDSAVIAFQTHDQKFKARWSSAKPDVPVAICPWTKDDRLPDNSAYLAAFIAWLDERLTENSFSTTMLAAKFIRGEEKMFPGIGVYSISEIFARAGLPPTLTVAELFRSPSRTARFLEGYYLLALSAWQLFPSVLSGALRGHLLAPTIPQRLKAGRDLFYVWAKNHVVVSNRLYALWESAKEDNRLHEPQVADIFELTDFRLAFGRKNHLLREVVGNRFYTNSCRGLPGITAVEGSSLLFDVYHKHGIYGEGDFLSLEEYDPPFLPPSLLHKKLLTVYAYRYGKGDSARTTWSLTPPAYENSLPQLEEKTRIQRLFKNVVALSEKVAVGPLEYCGNALAFRKPGPHRGDNSVHVALCTGDRAIKLGRINFYAFRVKGIALAKGDRGLCGFRRKSYAVMLAETKQKLLKGPRVAKYAQAIKARKYAGSKITKHEALQEALHGDAPSPDLGKRKRVDETGSRKSADMHLAASGSTDGGRHVVGNKIRSLRLLTTMS